MLQRNIYGSWYALTHMGIQTLPSCLGMPWNRFSAGISHGPAALSILCLMGGLATMGTSLYSLIEVKSWADAASRPVAIMMYGYRPGLATPRCHWPSGLWRAAGGDCEACRHLIFGIFVVFLEAEPDQGCPSAFFCPPRLPFSTYSAFVGGPCSQPFPELQML